VRRVPFLPVPFLPNPFSRSGGTKHLTLAQMFALGRVRQGPVPLERKTAAPDRVRDGRVSITS
jgi:hypothetical protein